VLVPTRELAMQMTTQLRDPAQCVGLRVLAVYGGQRVKAQADRLAKGPHLIVGTPGRVMDMHQRGLLPYDRLRFVVLDEVDRMLDIGFREDIRRILTGIRQKHQTIFVSATISKEIEALARSYMRDPVRLTVVAKSLTVAQVRQHYFTVEPWDKRHLLLHLLTHEEPALTLVFCRTKQTVDKVAEFLARHGIDVHAIHGDMYQGKRNRVMQKLREGELAVLIASDLASRGLDVEGITHVINYDLPEDPELYVHRIGRTARAGRGGEAWSFVSSEQGALLSGIEQLTNVEIPKMEYPDFAPGPVPPEVIEQRKRDQERMELYRTTVSREPTAPPTAVEAADATRFPGGLVPVALPSKRMGGRLRSNRR
jgi:ATP-dependent RNA helicase DeaD